MVNDSEEYRYNRRTFLKTGAVGTSIAMAGCTGGGNTPGGEQVPTIQIKAPQFKNYVPITRELAKQWERGLGITTNLETLSWSTYLSDIYTGGEFEHIAQNTFGPSPDRIDPEFYLSLCQSENTLNISRYENSEYDEKYSELTTTYDDERRNELITELQNIWFEDLPRMSVFRPYMTTPVNTNLWDIPPTNTVGVHISASKSWFEATQQGGESTLIIGGEGQYQSPNPLAPSGNPQQFLFKLSYDTLRRVNLDGEFENWAVQEFNVRDDTTIDLYLREDMSFHDGEDVTAEDLKFTFDLLTENSFPKYDPHTASIDSTEIRDDGAVRVNLSQPDAQFLRSASVFLPVLPEHIWSGAAESDEPVTWDLAPEDHIGSGPMAVESVATDRVEFSTNEDHWAAPDYDGIIYIARGSLEALRADLEEENIHVTMTAPDPNRAAEMAEPDSIEVATSPGLSTGEWVFRMDQPPFDDIAMRKAIRHATDASKIVEVYMNGQADIPDGTVVHPQQRWGTDEHPSMAETFSRDKARSVLEEAGYGWDDDGQLYYPEE
ncbi:ABC transporter substrate-binding protein [Halobellus sp. GM3]|uniref:ABC transporter substrate-binding protein n=1 Tax=Halobellus sp. GM3 TaxID=3458410 RepID=UPI00403DCFF6